MDILKEIERGESKTLEFKEKLPSSSKIIKTVIAFSNTAGGKLIIGVNDNREIIGVEEDIFELQDKITSIIYESCAPLIMPEIYTRNLNGKLILIIEIYRGNIAPYHIKSIGIEKGTYVRIGATNRLAGKEKILDLTLQHRNISFDEMINHEYNFEELDIKILEEKFLEVGKELTEEKMKSMRLIKVENNIIYPTNGLLIILGKFENVVTKCSRFKGTSMRVFLDKKEYIGDLFFQLKNIELFIKNNIHLESEITGLQRIDKYEIPEEAIRESIMNAIIHRDYINLGRDIKVAIYDDRIEIVSPGGLPNGLSNEDMLNGRSEIRNKVIAKVFKELNYIEQWGSGITRIKEACLEANLKEAFIEEAGDFIGVRLYRKVAENQKSGGKVAENQKSGGKVAENQKSGGKVAEKTQENKILDYLEKEREITSKLVEEILGVKNSRAKIILKNMLEKKLIERIGKGRATHYILNEKNS